MGFAPKPLIYATRSIIPSRFANAVQSGNMAHAFSKIYPTFSCIFRSHSSPQDVSAAFTGLELPFPPNACVVRTNDLLDWSNAYLAHYALSLGNQRRDALVYTRSGRIAWLATALGFETIIELHDPLTRPYAAWLQGLARRRPTLKLVTTTARLKADLLAQLDIPAGQVLVAGGGANAAFADLPPLPVPSSHSFNAGYAGSAFKGKGMEIVIACAARLPDVGFHVIGPSPEECRSLGRLTPNLIFHGRQDNRTTFGLLKGMDCLLLPNQRSVIIRSGADIGNHTSPLKMFEYMATGRPIIGSDLPVITSVLTNKETALLAAPDDAAGFCEHLATLRQDTSLSHELGSRARALFLQKHTWDMRAKSIQQFISG